MNGPRLQRSWEWQPHLAVAVLFACLLQPHPVTAGVAGEAPHSPAIAAALDTISALVDSGDLAAAEARATELLARTIRQDGPESLAVASVLDALFQIRKKSQNLRAPEARADVERSLRIKEARLCPFSLRISDSRTAWELRP